MIPKELVAASAEALVLSLLSKGESYGYAIIQEVRARSDNNLQWTDGMLYPVLHRMENNGWIKSRWVKMENGRKRKYYSLKKDGKAALDVMREVANRIETRREREELGREQKEKRQPVEADHHGPHGRNFKAVFYALIYQQRAQGKDETA